MITNIENIEVVFENCEALTINQEGIDYLELKDFSLTYGGSELYVITNKFELMLNKNANKPFQMFGEETTTFERLSHSDITQIHIQGDEGKVDSFYIDWDDTNPNFDKTQYHTQEGNSLTIGKKIKNTYSEEIA